MEYSFCFSTTGYELHLRNPAIMLVAKKLSSRCTFFCGIEFRNSFGDEVLIKSYLRDKTSKKCLVIFSFIHTQVIYSDNQNIKSTNSLSSIKKSNMASRRVPLSSISANSSHQTPSSSTLKKKSISGKPSSSNSLTSTTTQSSKKEQIECLYQETLEQRTLEEKNGNGFDLDNVISIFRKSRQLSHDLKFDTTLRCANPIHDSDTILMREGGNTSSSVTSQIFDDSRVDSSNLMSLYKPIEHVDAEESIQPEQKRFLEPPNDQFFSEDMEMMLTLKLGSPVYDSDSESDASEELSVAGQ